MSRTIYAVRRGGTASGPSVRRIPIAYLRWGREPFEDAGVGKISLYSSPGAVAWIARSPLGYKARIEDAEADWFEWVRPKGGEYWPTRNEALYALLRRLYGSAWPHKAGEISLKDD